MTISKRVRQQFYHPNEHQQQQHHQQLIRIPPRSSRSNDEPNDQPFLQASTERSPYVSPTHNRTWTNSEHERFLQALELFPSGPWKYIAAYVGNKTARQAMSHAQKYRQKIARRQRGLQVPRKASSSHQLSQQHESKTPLTPVRRPSSPIEVALFPSNHATTTTTATWSHVGIVDHACALANQFPNDPFVNQQHFEPMNRFVTGLFTEMQQTTHPDEDLIDFLSTLDLDPTLCVDN